MISDCIMNHETISSLSYYDEYLRKYGIMPEENVRAGVFNTEDISLLNALAIGLIYGVSQTTMHILFAAAAFGVAERLDNGESPTNAFTAMNTSLFGGFAL